MALSLSRASAINASMVSGGGALLLQGSLDGVSFPSVVPDVRRERGQPRTAGASREKVARGVPTPCLPRVRKHLSAMSVPSPSLAGTGTWQ